MSKVDFLKELMETMTIESVTASREIKGVKSDNDYKQYQPTGRIKITIEGYEKS